MAQPNSSRSVAVILPLLLALSVPAGVGAAETAPSRKPDFDRAVAPLLIVQCLDCHSGPRPKGDLDLTRKAAALKGGARGPAVVPGKPADSVLWQRVKAGEMPPKTTLPEADKALLQEWIASGAAWSAGPLDRFRFTTSRHAGADWWSWQPVRRPAPPVVQDESWGRTPLDRFILARLEAKGLQPSPEADRRTVLRRLSFDLRGLPPTPEEAEAFVNDQAPNAYERLVDRWLASPHYGERWARHWLDVVRFGESDGFERNAARPHAWPYRDWVIKALNDDLPYDEFCRLQIAGDVLKPGDLEAAKATGFLVAGIHNTVVPQNQTAQETAFQDELEDLVGSVGQSFLGLTVNCARCHDHKFDPIVQKDYYRFASALSGVRHGERTLLTILAQGQLDRLQVEVDRLKSQLAAIEAAVRQAILADRKARKSTSAAGELIAEADLAAGLAPAARKQRSELMGRLAATATERSRWQDRHSLKMYAALSAPAPVTRLLVRGQVTEPGDTVAPGGIAALAQPGPDFGLKEDAPEAERRKKLAAWLTDRDNPLFARVLVNRLWHYHFGTGIVETPNDLGFNGGRPSHPELLDWLAVEFAERGYSLKAMHRLIVTSAAYRQASAPRTDGLAADAEARLLWRKKPRRLEGEALRDSLLTVSGLLNRAVGGRGFSDYKESGGAGTQYYDPYDPVGVKFQCRSVYRFSPRSANPGLLDVFDCPDSAAAAPRRNVTTTPLQALALWNGAFTLRMAEALAARLAAEAPHEAARQVTLAYRLAFQREPLLAERDAARRLVERHGLKSLCRALFNTNEFLTVD